MLIWSGLLMEPFGYTPAAMPVDSIVEQGHNLLSTAIGASIMDPLSFHKRESDFEHTSSLVDGPIISTLILVRAWSGTACRYLRTLFLNARWRSTLYITKILIWDGQQPILGLLHTTQWSIFRTLVPLTHPHTLSLPITVV